MLEPAMMLAFTKQRGKGAIGSLFALVALVAIAALGGIMECSGDGADASGHGPVHPPFKKTWEFTAKDGFENFLVVGDTVYFATLMSYGAVDLATGKGLWEKSVANERIGYRVAHNGKTLYVAIGEGRFLLACEPKTGKELWRLPLKLSEYPGPMTAQEDTLYCELQQGLLTALDIRTRKARWTFDLKRPPEDREDRRLWMSVEPLVAGDRLFVATRASHVLCLDSQRGRRHWRCDLGEDAGWVYGMVVEGQRVYCTTNSGKLFALDINNGERLWRFGVKGGIYHAPAVLGDTVFFTARDGNLHAVNGTDGKLKWRCQLPHESRSPSPAPPVVHSGQVIVELESNLFAFDAEGNGLWEWDTEEDDRSNEPLVVLKGGLLLSDGDSFYRFVMGDPPALPTSVAERRALAQRLVDGFDRLSKDEKRTLRKLGDEAFEALLPVVKQRLERYVKLEVQSGAEHDEGPFRAYQRFHDAFEIVRDVTQPRHTPSILALLPLTGPLKGDWSGASNLFDLLAYKGDERALPLFLREVRKGQQGAGFCAGLRYITSSSHPDAVKFLIEQLADPKADPEVRHEAFVNLARIGGAAGLEAVLKAKDTRRIIPPIEQFIRLGKLGTAVKARRESSSDLPQLLATRKDKKGVLWGLIASAVLGSDGDLWIGRHDGKRWTRPLFTGIDINLVLKPVPLKGPPRFAGMTRKQLIERGGWFTRFLGNAALSKDTDCDGWTDMVERRLGTNPNKADTDGDGLMDSQDKNPLAAPRLLSEAEQVLAAAFEARFIFGYGREVPCLVSLPKGVEPFELFGWDWVIIPQRAGESSPLIEVTWHGVADVTMGLREDDDDQDNTSRPRGVDDFVAWNEDRTEANLPLDTGYGGLDGTGFRIRLKKFGARWIVIGTEMVWVS